MVTWSHHGGGCCGIICLFDFDYYGPSHSFPPPIYKTWEEALKDTIDAAMHRKFETKLTSSWNCLVEVVLISQQADNGWGQLLEGMGFKEVSKFRNSNSSNMCHVFHLQTREMK